MQRLRPGSTLPGTDLWRPEIDNPSGQSGIHEVKRQAVGASYHMSCLNGLLTFLREARVFVRDNGGHTCADFRKYLS